MMFKRKIVVLFLLALFPLSAYSADFKTFINDLRDIFYSVQGKAIVFAYTKEFGFAEVKEGSFKVGDLVLIKSSELRTGSEELAFGEIEDIKGKIIRIYITNVMKPLRKDAFVVGLKRIYANVKIEDSNPLLKNLFLREPEIVVQESRDNKTNLIITLTKNNENSYGYKAITPSGRLLLIGSLSLDAQRDMVSQQKSVKLAFEEETGRYWLFKDGELYCHSCTAAMTTKLEMDGNVTNIYAERNKIYIQTDKQKTVVLENKNSKTYDGFITQGDELLYFSKEGKLYDLKKEKVFKEFSEKLDVVYYWKKDVGIGRTGDKLILFNNDSVKELSLSDVPIFRIKDDKIYLYKELSETVPLSGTYLALYLEIYDPKTVTLQKRLEINETLLDFDVDEKNNELIIVKSDSTIKRIKF